MGVVVRRKVSKGTEAGKSIASVFLVMLLSVILYLFVLFALLALLGTGYDYFARYWSWRSLSVAHISEASQWYIDHRTQSADEIAGICVYALDCSGDRARLAIVDNLDGYDFEALKDLIWARRFDGMCEGQTANLGLYLLRAENLRGNDNSDHAIWSFYNNRFIPMNGHWSGGAFSEEPWVRCSADAAAFVVEDGVVRRASD